MMAVFFEVEYCFCDFCFAAVVFAGWRGVWYGTV